MTRSKNKNSSKTKPLHRIWRCQATKRKYKWLWNARERVRSEPWVKKMLDGRWLQSFKKVRKRLSQGPGRLWCQHTKPSFLQRKNIPEKETSECQGHAPVSRHVGGLYTFHHGSQQAQIKNTWGEQRDCTELEQNCFLMQHRASYPHSISPGLSTIKKKKVIWYKRHYRLCPNTTPLYDGTWASVYLGVFKTVSWLPWQRDNGTGTIRGHHC